MKKTMKKKAKIVKKVKKTIKKVGSKSDFGIRPLADRILLKPISADEMKTTSSGIIIPDTVSKEKPEQGIVVAVGDGKWDDGVKIPLSVKVGDKVVFSRYGYDEVKLDGVEYYILKEENILAVIKN
jgi:chaperonin GroES